MERFSIIAEREHRNTYWQAFHNKIQETVGMVSQKSGIDDKSSLKGVYLLVAPEGSKVLVFSKKDNENVLTTLSEDGISDFKYKEPLFKWINLKKHPNIFLPNDPTIFYRYTKRESVRHYISDDGVILYNIYKIQHFLTRSRHSVSDAEKLLIEVQRICKYT